MYYLGKHGALVPAESPLIATVNDKHEWHYGQDKHVMALKTCKGLVDKSVPRCVNPAVQRVHEASRRFYDDQRKAEIGRDNRKMVDRLSHISKGSGGTDPRGPPPALPPQPIGPRGGSGSLRPPLASSAPLPAGTASAGPIAGAGSLNVDHRRKTQQGIEQDNAHLVRRILSVKGSFDKKVDRRDFERHQRTVQLLQRLPDGPSGGGSAARRNTRPSSLPPLRPPRPSSDLPHKPKDLDSLFLMADLQRSDSGPSSFGSGDRAMSPLMRERKSAVLISEVDDSREDDEPSTGSDDQYGGGASSRNIERNRSGESQVRSARPHHSPTAPLDPNQDAFGMPPSTPFSGPEQEETERRRWLSEEQQQRKEQEAAASESTQKLDASPDHGLTGGVSTESLPYAEDWDEFSMASSGGSPLRTRSQGGATNGFGSTTSLGKVPPSP